MPSNKVKKCCEKCVGDSGESAMGADFCEHPDCPCHATHKNSEWKFILAGKLANWYGEESAKLLLPSLLSFIENLLQERSKDKVGELIEKIEGMRKEVKYEETTDISKALTNGAENYGYNSALKDVLQKLSEQIEQK